MPNEVTPLTSRLFGTWTLISTFIRLYAAYNITCKPLYILALWSYIVVVAHFLLEWLVYGTMQIGGDFKSGGLTPILITSITTIAWMLWQLDFYVNSS